MSEFVPQEVRIHYTADDNERALLYAVDLQRSALSEKKTFKSHFLEKEGMPYASLEQCVLAKYLLTQREDLISCAVYYLTLSQTTNCRLFQTERVYSQQF